MMLAMRVIDPRTSPYRYAKYGESVKVRVTAAEFAQIAVYWECRDNFLQLHDHARVAVVVAVVARRRRDDVHPSLSVAQGRPHARAAAGEMSAEAEG
jgi:hypothetical protein